MNPMQSQRGSLIIVVVILIVVVGLLASTITFIFVGSERASVQYVDATSALFFAESGIEKGMREISLNSNYTGEGPTNFGAGRFTISVSTQNASGNPLPAGQRRITSQGEIGNVNASMRSVEAIVLTSAIQFLDPFNGSIANWSVQSPNGIALLNTCPLGNTVTSTTQGTVSYDIDNAPSSLGGSFEAEITGKSHVRTGYHEATVAIAENTPVALEFWYKKIRNKRPIQMMMAIDFVSTTSNVYRIWSNCTLDSTAGWVKPAPTNWTVPAGNPINRIRLVYDLENPRNPTVTTVRFDDVKLSLSGGTILSWREVFP